MAMAEGIMKRLSDIKQERQWISGEIDFLNKRVDDFKRRIQRVEAEISHLQEIQDAVSNSEDRSSNRLAGLMRERRRHLVEMQYALPSVYEELKRLVKRFTGNRSDTPPRRSPRAPHKLEFHYDEHKLELV